jgi:enediyne biosynthesis protein E4
VERGGSRNAFFAVAAIGVAVAYAVMRSGPTGSSPEVAEPRGWFVDRAAETGLAFVHFNGMSGAMFFPEIMAPGVGLVDFDNDGDLDVFLPQGQMLGTGKTLSQALFPPKVPPQGRLFRNDLQVHANGPRTMRFTDVTDSSGINANGYGMGVAVGDVDNDGWVDLYVTNFGRNQLFRNNGDGTFADASKQSNTDDPGWSVSAAFVDYDRDGWLDLFIGNYVNYSTDANVQCRSMAGMPDYCAPFVYPPQPSRLLRNQRNGTFVDVTAAAGLSREFGPSLGVATADFNGDGWIDVYVANDLQPNQLWMNQSDGTFKNTALLAGVALGSDGNPKSSMGVEAGDFDNDGDEDLFVTELTGQGADLYVNDGSGLFADQSARSGLRVATLPYTGFGTAWFDFDNDGWLDILTVNGAVMGVAEIGRTNDPFPFNQLKQLFRNLGDGRFEDVTTRAGVAFERSAVGRGAAFGDLDNDGDVDVVVGNANGHVELLINEIEAHHHWIGLRLVGGQPPRDIVGARLGVVGANGSTVWRRARADGSYASASDSRVLVGLGETVGARRARVVWPDGRVEEWSGLPIDRYTTLTQGTGTAVARGGAVK